MHNPLIMDIQVITQQEVALAGGKAANLGDLARGLKVPPGFCITSEAYKMHMSQAKTQEKVLQLLQETNLQDLRAVEQLSKAITQLILELPLLAEHVAAITTAYQQLTQKEAGMLVAVRSSATAEDAPEASFAGQQESYLDIADLAAVLGKVKECWASLWTARAIHYRGKKGYDQGNVQMAVIIQQMVPAQISGVMFTANPVNNNRRQIMIEASTGLGEALVSGLVTGEKYIIAKKGYRLLSVTGANPARGPLLNEDQLRQLAHYGYKIEEFYEAHQDVEWALLKGEFYFLQTRPITTLADELPPEINWEKLNLYQKEIMTTIVERYPEPIYPIDGAVTKVIFLAQFESMAKLGYFVPEIDWQRIEKGIFPEFFLPPAIRLGWRRLFAFLRLRKILRSNPAAVWQRDSRELLQHISFVRNKKLSNFPYEVVFEYLEDALKEINLFSAMRYTYFVENRLPSSILAWLLKRLYGPQAKAMHESLLAGIECVTLEVNHKLRELAAQASPEVAEVIRNNLPAKLPEQVAAVSGGEAFLTAFAGFLENYGERETSIGLGGIAVPTWRETPEVVWGILKTLLSGGLEADLAQEQAVQVRRQQAEENLRCRLQQGLWAVLPIRSFIHRLLEHNRSFAAFRENSHYDLAKALGVLRVLYLELGKRFTQQKLFTEPADIMYISYFELKDLIYELFHYRTVKEKSWHQKIVENKALYQRRLARWNARGNRIQRTGDELRGVAACSGVVTGPARIIHDPREFYKLQAGDILVAPYTNPTWTPLFSAAAGIVADTGGAASHTAIIAREYGIPAVMGVPGASKIIQDGEMITIDGSQGLVSRQEMRKYASKSN